MLHEAKKFLCVKKNDLLIFPSQLIWSDMQGLNEQVTVTQALIIIDRTMPCHFSGINVWEFVILHSILNYQQITAICELIIIKH